MTAPQTGRESRESTIEPPARRWLTRGIASIGAASFFSDWGHEIATSLLPALVTHTLRSSAGALGLIEGMSDALTGVAKLFGGSLANDPERRVRLAGGGYIVTAAATGAIGAVTAVWQVGLLRAVAWSARGVRSPARDAMLASLAAPETYGRAYGLERAGDNLGAAVGPLTAAGLVSAIGIRSSIYLAAIPGALAAAAREARARRAAAQQERRIHLELSALRRAGVVRPLLPIAMFELGNCATTLLILRATDLLHHGGRSVTAAASLAILMYAGHNLLGTIFAFVGGHWIDRASPRLAFAAGAAIFAAAYGLFALGTHSAAVVVLAFLLAGSGIGLAEAAESTTFARLLPDHLRGSGFGLLGGVQSFGDLTSSAIVGALWSAVSPAAGFLYAAGWMTLSIIAGLRPRL